MRGMMMGGRRHGGRGPGDPRRPLLVAGMILAGVCLAGTGVGGGAPRAGAEERGDSWGSEALDQTRRSAIVRAAERVGPAVVGVSVTQVLYTRERGRSSPFGDDIFDLFFHDFFPQRWRREEIPSLGSGVIVRPEGVILTNEHVVRGAQTIKVTLTDGREFDGELVGNDPSYDLALVRITGEDLPAAPLGNSDLLLTGEWAIAIGNPFGYLLNDPQPTVTAGVISAIHRDIKPQAGQTGVYQDMIQTDAAINPGNSGGPLVNSWGEVIGLNTFIFTRSGGSLGMGFAVPINTARRVMEEILQYGRVRPIWIGVVVRELETLWDYKQGRRVEEGVVVAEVEEGSPAAEAGLHPGDLITAVDGKPVRSVAEAQRALFGRMVGDEVEIEIERQQSTRRVKLVVGQASS